MCSSLVPRLFKMAEKKSRDFNFSDFWGDCDTIIIFPFHLAEKRIIIMSSFDPAISVLYSILGILISFQTRNRSWLCYCVLQTDTPFSQRMHTQLNPNSFFSAILKSLGTILDGALENSRWRYNRSTSMHSLQQTIQVTPNRQRISAICYNFFEVL